MLLLFLTIQLTIISLNAANPLERLPTLWNEAPSSLSNYPLVSNCPSSQTTTNSSCRLIDPWLYLHRLGLCKILINVTTPYMTFCTTSSSLSGCNLLFGLAAHVGWQFDSNRLFSNGGQNISIHGWIYSSRFISNCLTFDECSRQAPDAMLQWRTFFLTLPHSASTSFVCSICEPRDECYLGPLWTAHAASIQNALPIIERSLVFLPSHHERRFGLGWVNVFTLTGMARTNLDLPNTNEYQDDFLPNGMLTEDDKPPHCANFSSTVNLALQLLFEVRIEAYPDLIGRWDQTTNFCYEQRRYAQLALFNAPLSKITALIYYELALISPLTC